MNWNARAKWDDTTDWDDSESWSEKTLATYPKIRIGGQKLRILVAGQWVNIDIDAQNL